MVSFSQFAAFLLSACAILAPWQVGLRLADVASPSKLALQRLVTRDVGAQTLRVGVIASPTVSSHGAFQQVVGLERGLVEAFVNRAGRTAEYRVYASASEARAALLRGEIDIAPMGYSSDKFDKLVITSVNYLENPWIFVYSNGTKQPQQWDRLSKQVVSVQPRIYENPKFAELIEKYPDVRFTPYPSADEEDILAAVDSGMIHLAVVERNLIDSVQHIYQATGKGFTVHETSRAWLLRESDTALLGDVNHFLADALVDRTIASLKERHFGHTLAVNSFDAMMFEDRVAQVLPKWKANLTRAQEETGLDWRLLASLAYQESQWQPKAVSYTGVNGFMQLTQTTADMYRVDRTDPNAAITAGAKHLAYLYRATPDRIADPDRMWFAIAAYNVGLGHVEDARILAQQARLNPDSWADVKKHLPSLANPKIAAATKHGLARGHETVDYVDRIRTFYELMARYEAPYQPVARTQSAGTQVALRGATIQ